MLVQKQLEEKIVSELKAAFAAAGTSDRCSVVGAWRTVGVGLVRWIEDEAPEDPALVSVAVGNPSHMASASSDTTIQANVTLFVRIELDPTGTTLESLASTIQDTLSSWNAETYQQQANRFDLPELAVDNVQIQQGDSPLVNGRILSVTWPITFSASFQSTSAT